MTASLPTDESGNLRFDVSNDFSLLGSCSPRYEERDPNKAGLTSTRNLQPPHKGIELEELGSSDEPKELSAHNQNAPRPGSLAGAPFRDSSSDVHAENNGNGNSAEINQESSVTTVTALAETPRRARTSTLDDAMLSTEQSRRSRSFRAHAARRRSSAPSSSELETLKPILQQQTTSRSRKLLTWADSKGQQLVSVAYVETYYRTPEITREYRRGLSKPGNSRFCVIM